MSTLVSGEVSLSMKKQNVRTLLFGLLSYTANVGLDDENLYYKGVNKNAVDSARLAKSTSLPSLADPPESEVTNVKLDTEPSHPPYLFSSGDSLLALTRKHNMTIAQLVYDNELHFHTHDEIHEKLMRIWSVMDDCIRTGVLTSDTVLPGRLRLRRRAPGLYRRLMRGFYPAVISTGQLPVIDSPTVTPAINEPNLGNARASAEGTDFIPLSRTRSANVHSRPTRVVGSLDHSVLPMPPRRTVFPAMDWLSCYAISVNEVNASGGRIVTSPTNGAAGVIPAVLKYIVEFVSEDPEKSIKTFLLTAAAVGMLFKRGSTISAAEGGCQAEVGVACSMASAGFAACMGASPEIILQAAEIGIEHNLGLTCDPIDGLVQVPCIERNSLGAVKAVTASQLAMASDGVYSVTLDEAIEAMRLTARDMSVKYKETSLSGLARKVVVVGDGGCGKFEDVTVRPYDQIVELSLWDTAGQEDFDQLRSLSYAETHVVILCFSVDNPVSLDNVESKLAPDSRHSALKCDLREDKDITERLARYGRRPVQYEEGLMMARQIRASRYLAASTTAESTKFL
ncbi:hypothetical protein Clacol_005510 [Clathrus columnatus]|uniref:Serine dehydratase-like alpha subunit domain-containing protein n=1 Tax=Clathrus columnatus TaxID=1419009 RepID=A0AAV5AF56_9AGAM|nr:hypothetical protein Clacol_005510 [Clathrus columnatus]